MQTELQYHVVAINEKTGKATMMTATTVTHKQGCTIMSKLTPHPLRRIQLLEAK